MGLTSSLRIGSTALTASQAALQATGNNLANAATPGYSRQTPHLLPLSGDGTGVAIGQGVRLADIIRQVDSAVQSRLWSGISDEAQAKSELQILSQVESALGELTDHDFSSQLTDFFNVWSERAGLVGSPAVVVQQGEQLASYLQQLRQDLVNQRTQIDSTLDATVRRSNALVSEIARLNKEIVAAEGGRGVAGGLRDQRDQLVGELSEYLDVSVHEQPGGSYDVLAGSTPLVIGSNGRELTLSRETVGDDTEVRVLVGKDKSPLKVSSGTIAAMITGRDGAAKDMIDRLDQVASQLIFETNKLHATGSNIDGYTSLSGTLSVAIDDRTRALNDPANNSLATNAFQPKNGGFFVHVTDETQGTTRLVRIDVDLDGLDDNGLPGFGDDTSLEDIRAQLNAIGGMSAAITPDGRLDIRAQSGTHFAFADDSSDTLAVLGVNAYFTGRSARDISVRSNLQNQPSLMATGRIQDGSFVENGTALAMSDLRDKTLAALGGESLSGSWSAAVQTTGLKVAGAATRADAASVVREGIEAQRASISGVNIDEEAINLITFQQQYQGAARYISVIDQLTQELIALV